MRLALLLCLAFVTSAQAQQTHAVIVAGVGGEPRLVQRFGQQAQEIQTALVRRFGVAHEATAVLTETSSPRSDRAAVLQALQQAATRSKSGDQILVVFIGHGSAQGGTPRINLPGPDLTAADLADALRAFRGRQLAVVIATSASGAFMPALAQTGYTIVTATRSAGEGEEVVFPEFVARAISQDVADTDKDGRLSLLEILEYARTEVARYYQQQNRLATEHALLDQDGEARARAFQLSAASGAATSTPALQALEAQRRALEAQVAQLRDRKAQMSEAAYEQELERLLLALARKTQEIRAQEKR